MLGLLCLGGQAPQRLWSATEGRPGRPPTTATCEAPCTPARLAVLSLNVLCAFCTKEGYDPWAARVPHLRALLSELSPDVIALQEIASRAVLADLLGPLSGDYAVVAAPGYTDSLLLIRQGRLHVEDSGEVWLSPTPLLPLGWAWQPLSFPRLVVWARLRDAESGQAILVASTHLDNSPPNKTGGAALLGEAVAPLAERLPVVLLGDLNLHAGDGRLDSVRGGWLHDAEALAAAREARGVLADVPHTRRELQPDRRIDHVLVGGPTAAEVMVERWIHLAPVYGDPPRRPSDHPAVYADLQIGGGGL